MQTDQTAAEPTDNAPLPRQPELVLLSLRIDPLQTSGDDTDAVIAARSLDHVACLIAEIDRLRPRRKRYRVARAHADDSVTVTDKPSP